MLVPLGAVLCGGASTRMGSDKATLPVRGVAMAQRVADALTAAGCAPVVMVGGDARELQSLRLEHVDDDFPGEGPLGGILTALARGSAALVVACDVPNIRPQTLRRLIDTLGDHQAAIACTEHLEPLCALWSPSASATLRSRFVAGERAVHRAIEGLDVVAVTVPADELRNVNTPDDLNSL